MRRCWALFLQGTDVATLRTLFYFLLHTSASGCSSVSFISFIINWFTSVTQLWLTVTPWAAAHQASLSITNLQSLLTHIHQVGDVIQPSHPLSSPSACHQSFLASGFFQMSQFFTSGGQGIGASASASVLPMNIQDRFPLGLTGLISLQSKRLSRVLSNTTV